MSKEVPASMSASLGWLGPAIVTLLDVNDKPPTPVVVGARSL